MRAGLESQLPITISSEDKEADHLAPFLRFSGKWHWDWTTSEWLTNHFQTLKKKEKSRASELQTGPQQTCSQGFCVMSHSPCSCRHLHSHSLDHSYRVTLEFLVTIYLKKKKKPLIYSAAWNKSKSKGLGVRCWVEYLLSSFLAVWPTWCLWASTSSSILWEFFWWGCEDGVRE